VSTPQPPAPGQGETIEQGRAPRAPRSRRSRTALVLAVAGLVLVAVVADHQVRRRESERLDGCVRDATSAVRFASARVDGIATYVRPALDSRVPASLRRRLDHLVSVSVAPTVPGVRRARDRCRVVRVLVLHSGLQATRADCLALLERDLGYLGGILRDGSRAFASRSLPAGRCTAP
jgi:hypothetical protein